MEHFIGGPEQQAGEILVEQGFAQPEDLEPEVARLLREASKLAREEGVEMAVEIFFLLYGPALEELGES